MNRRGVDVGFIVKLVLWVAILILVFFIVKKYIVGTGSSVLGPADSLLG